MNREDPERLAAQPKLNQPDAAPPVVGRDAFDAALAQQVAREKEVTRHNDRVSAERRRLPMVEVENYTFEGPGGPVKLTDLFGEHYLLLVQNVMFSPDWEAGCPSCTWAVDNLPADEERDRVRTDLPGAHRQARGLAGKERLAAPVGLLA